MLQPALKPVSINQDIQNTVCQQTPALCLPLHTCSFITHNDTRQLTAVLSEMFMSHSNRTKASTSKNLETDCNCSLPMYRDLHQLTRNHYSCTIMASRSRFQMVRLLAKLVYVTGIHTAMSAGIHFLVQVKIPYRSLSGLDYATTIAACTIHAVVLAKCAECGHKTIHGCLGQCTDCPGQFR